MGATKDSKFFSLKDFTVRPSLTKIPVNARFSRRTAAPAHARGAERQFWAPALARDRWRITYPIDPFARRPAGAPRCNLKLASLDMKTLYDDVTLRIFSPHQFSR